MKPPAVSVIIPVYNRPSIVLRAINSALKQILPPLEIIVVDDGSEPPLTLPSFISSPARIMLLRFSSNLGPAAARQAGINAAKGRYVAFLDSDDVWYPQKLEAQMGLLADSHTDLLAVTCGWQTERDVCRGLATLPRESNELSHFLSGCWFNPGSTIVLPKDVFDCVGPFDNSLRRLEDFEWFLRWASKGGRLRVAPVIGAYIQRSHCVSMTEVRHATEKILERYEDKTYGIDNSPDMRSRLAAWLALNRAGVAMKCGLVLPLVCELIRSFAARPRTNIHLEDWWSATNVATSIGDTTGSVFSSYVAMPGKLNPIRRPARSYSRVG